ncbi:PepSY-associated TM helix domain-containing protein [Aureibacter tunicatorum]|uniref:PepSY domain-containing protein n=1 Tax=Aureibacter tunicatorum TaxID=866807 RepID=A0AAE3XLU3_9BACT|nr:PepSY-associated TM helix domain-containing protein [Aureibacter tunicatorum]MDR6238953.1 hypothetical protein [Aureibacter tunicatorum]
MIEEVKVKRKTQSGVTLNRGLYRWHKWLGIICALPVVLWCLSGFMHPVMSNFFKLKPSKRRVESINVDNHDSLLSFQAALGVLNKSKINNAKAVMIDDSVYYQFLAAGNNHFINAESGEKLIGGDSSYAEYLARYFIQDFNHDLISVEYIDEFDNEYLPINRYLPVYKVVFKRDDNMTLYVDVNNSRLATLMDNAKIYYQWFFRNFHTWSFLDSDNPIRIIGVIILLMVLLISSIFGIWIYIRNWFKYKRMKSLPKLRNRKRHRQVGLISSIFILMFSFSGIFHALLKFDLDNRYEFFLENEFETSAINFNPFAVADMKVSNFHLVQIGQENAFRVNSTKETSFYSLEGKKINFTDDDYAKYLATTFADKELKEVESVGLIRKFNHDYGFINKKLPVNRVNFKSENNLSVYVENNTSSLSVMVDDYKRLEGLSFSMLHKLHFLDSLGKPFRDSIVVVSILMILLVVFFGLRTLL